MEPECAMTTDQNSELETSTTSWSKKRILFSRQKSGMNSGPKCQAMSFGILKVKNETTLSWKYFQQGGISHSDASSSPSSSSSSSPPCSTVVDSMILHTFYHLPFQAPIRHSPSLLTVVFLVLLLSLLLLLLIFVRKRLLAAWKAKSCRVFLDGIFYSNLHRPMRVVDDEDEAEDQI